MKAIKVRAIFGEKEKEEVWVLPLNRLVAAEWEKTRGRVHLHFDKIFFTTSDPDGALLEEVSRAFEAPDGTYAIGGLWAYEWVE